MTFYQNIVTTRQFDRLVQTVSRARGRYIACSHGQNEHGEPLVRILSTARPFLAGETRLEGPTAATIENTISSGDKVRFSPNWPLVSPLRKRENRVAGT